VDRVGFHRVSIDAVAKAAGITRPIVYDHFKNLDALLYATFVRETQRALGQLTTLLPRVVGLRGPRELLIESLEAYLEAVAADPATWRLVLMAPEGTPASLHEAIEEGREAIIAVLSQVVVTRQPSPDPELTARLLSALSDDMARLHLGDPARYPVERLVDQARWFISLL